MTQRPKKLMERVSDAIRRKHYSYLTEQTYIHWVYPHVLNRGPAAVRSPLDV